MGAVQVPRALAERLGEEGTQGLVTLLDATGAAWAHEVLTVSTERFERRFTGEISTLRVDMVREFSRTREEFGRELSSVREQIGRELSDLRQEFGGELSDLRQEFGGRLSELRQEFGRELSELRKEFGAELSAVRGEAASGRVDLLKWAFLFWVGQVAATAGLLSFMLRTVG